MSKYAIQRDSIVSAEFNEEVLEVTIENRPLSLSKEEYTILKLIKEAEGAIVYLYETKEAIEYTGSDSDMFLNQTVNTLKHKLGRSGKEIEKILGIGFRLKRDLS